MSTGGKKKNRTQRVAPLDLPPGSWARLRAHLRRREVLGRLAMCLAAMAVIWGVGQAWAPPFRYRLGFVPQRDITARIDFRLPNPIAVEDARRLARSQTPSVYRQDPEELELLRAALQNAVTEIANDTTFAEVNKETWLQFQVTDQAANTGALEDEEQFEAFRTALRDAVGLTKFEEAVAVAFGPYEKHGLLEKLPEGHDSGNKREITVYPVGVPERRILVPVSDVLIGDAKSLHQRLQTGLPPALADRTFAWIRPRLKPTLTLDQEATLAARDRAGADIDPSNYDTLVAAGESLARGLREVLYDPNVALPPNSRIVDFFAIGPDADMLVVGTPLDAKAIETLEFEQQQILQQRSIFADGERSTAIFGLLAAIFGLCGYYVYFRDRRLISDWRRLATLLVLGVATVAVVPWTSRDPSRTELIPLLVFGMTFSIAYARDIAMVLSLALAGIMVVIGGLSLGDFFILFTAVTSAIAQLGRIRSRSKLIKVGTVSAVVVFLTTLVVGLLEEQPLDATYLVIAGRNALWTFLAGFLVTGLLPMIESLFGVLTEISLLEWSDVSHPLLQELVRRAPGTYNHSINVASLAEAAAESIGARGLLVRVGAYFHDIGKVLKPDYFAENQSFGSNRHDSLVPAMSTLIIIAHVKDGVDLARQHDLPEPIVDFIEQHHGTTLVEYFFHRASEQRESDPNAADVLESSYRYPGPRPQTVEAAVLMLADAVESASRALVEPTPARLEGLVDDIAMKRLLDGQFDGCSLTLEQLRTVQNSLVKSLTAVYHGRVKYPKQQTA